MTYGTSDLRISDKDLTGELKDFPLELVWVLVRCAKQGTSYKKEVIIKAYQSSILRGRDAIGFDWKDTPEGYAFWEDVLIRRNFVRWFKQCPIAPGYYVPDKNERLLWVSEEMPAALIQLIIRTADFMGTLNRVTTNNSILCLFPFRESPQGLNFWSEIYDHNYSEFTDTKTIKISSKNENNAIELCNQKTLAERGVVPEGSIICGKAGKSSITVRSLSFRSCSGR